MIKKSKANNNQVKTIEINGVTKEFAEGDLKVLAVDCLSMTVDRGEFLAVVGPSGSGKTTLLNLIGGLDKPTNGEIFIEGFPIHSMQRDALTNFRLRNIGFVFQAYNLIPVLTAGENIEFVMRLLGYPSKECEIRTMELLESVGLADRRNSRPAKLSGGQQQRVAVARSLASRPKFVLADEPTANLDSHSADTLLDIMESLNQKEGVTFIFSTHDPRIMQRANRIVSLKDGKLSSD